MARISLTRPVKCSLEAAWAAISDLESHVHWMQDAEKITFGSDQRRGVGTTMSVLTVVGPFRTIDMMEVTDWEEGRSITVDHRGLVKGVGTLSVKGNATETQIGWDEELVFPWWLGGRFTALFARPFLTGIWRKNLRRLEAELTGL